MCIELGLWNFRHTDTELSKVVGIQIKLVLTMAFNSSAHGNRDM